MAIFYHLPVSPLKTRFARENPFLSNTRHGSNQMRERERAREREEREKKEKKTERERERESQKERQKEGRTERKQESKTEILMIFNSVSVNVSI